jgi:hypothetical protein
MTFFGVDVRNGVPVGLGSIAAFGRRGFTPASLFAQGAPGVWYDASDLGTMFQDSDGTTPVTAVEQAVGLILDKSRGLAIGSELVTNGDFSSATGWTAEAGWSIGSGVATAAVTGTNLTGTSFPVVAGRTYRVEFDVVTFTSGILYVRVGEGTATSFTTTGRKSAILTATNTTGVQFYGGSIACSIDNVSVREIAGTHAIQATAASRPVLRNRYNLLTYSEQFDNAAWVLNDTSITSNNTTAPDGTTTADRVNLAAGTAKKWVGQVVAAHAGSRTYSFSAKYNTHQFIQFLNNGTVNGFANFDIQNGVAGTTGTGVTATMASQGNGWFRCTVTHAIAAATEWRIYAVDSNSAAWDSTTTSTGTYWVWGADLRDAPDTIYPYQRIEAATVYDSDTSKFPLYLALDGSDDSLYTAANLDLSSTDKVSVFTGVTKLSDAATGVTLEFSADAGTNNGTWGVYAPGAAAAPRFDATSRGTTARGAGVNSAPYAAPITTALTAIGNISGDLTEMRLDGVSVNSNTGDQGTGNYGTYPLYIGRRNNASLPFNGRIYQLIVRGAASSAAEISSAERWVAGKQGRAL